MTRLLPGGNLERRDQRAPRRIPVEIHLGLVDRDRFFFVLRVSDPSALGYQAALDHLRHEIRADLRPDASGNRDVELEVTFVETHCKKDVPRRYLPRLDLDAALLISARNDGRRQLPRVVVVFGAEIENHAAASVAIQAEIDLLEGPGLAVAAVIDDQVAVLQTELAENFIFGIRLGEAVDPGHERREIGGAGGWRRRRIRLGGARQRRGGVGRRGFYDRRRDRDRAAFGAGRNGDLAIGLDAHGKFGADEAHALGMQASHQEAGRGDRDFGFGRGRDDRAVGIADQDVANAKRHAAVIVTLDLGAADLDPMTVAERVFDRRGEEWRRHVDRHRAGGKPYP